jgi:hypothetical protein
MEWNGMEWNNTIVAQAQKQTFRRYKVQSWEKQGKALPRQRDRV